MRRAHVGTVLVELVAFNQADGIDLAAHSSAFLGEGGCYRRAMPEQSATGVADQLISANKADAGVRVPVSDGRPARHLAIVTCMDVRIDVLPAMGLALGDAHVLRNAGGRVTDDTLRSLAVSTHLLGTDMIVVMHHTQCGMSGPTNEALRVATGAPFDFRPIADHTAALQEDVAMLAAQSFLADVRAIFGFLYDVESSLITPVVTETR